MKIYLCFALAIVALAATAPVRAQEPTMADVLASTPGRANSILYVDVPALRGLAAGTVLQTGLSDKLGEVRIASELSIQSMEPVWEVGYTTVSGLPDAKSLAASVGGYVDTIAGKSVVWSPKQMYLVPMASDLLGLVRPSDRTIVGQWLRKEQNGNAAQYLATQSKQATKFISLLLAVDLEDAFSQIAIRHRIDTFESLKGADLDSIAATIATVKGIRIIVGRNNLDECIISLDFASSPASLLPVAKQFFVEVLDRNDSSIPEASKWVPTVEGNTLAYRGTISAQTIDEIIGIFTLQSQASALPSSTDKPLPLGNTESVKVAASKAYFDKTSEFIKDVRTRPASSTSSRARWNGVVARRIDELGTLNVDPDLIAYGAAVSQALRGNMLAIQQTNLAYAASGMPAYNNYYGNYGDVYSYYDLNDLSRSNVTSKAQGNMTFSATMAAIEQLESDTRRKLTEKYKVQF